MTKTSAEARSPERCLSHYESLPTFSRVQSLEAMKALLELLGNPQDRLRILHVAGSNGKGSTCALLEGILQEGGYATGFYHSPAIPDFLAGIRIGCEPMDLEGFCAAYPRVMEACDILSRRGLPSPSRFEAFTALAYLVFLEAGVDFAIMEVGLGGTLDATNVMGKSLLSLITAISLDHTDILGNTLEAVASQKAGILKKGCPVLLGENPSEVVRTVLARAQALGSPLHDSVPSSDLEVVDASIHGTTLVCRHPWYAGAVFTTPLVGVHQRANIGNALGAAHLLQEMGAARLPLEVVQKALSTTVWPGRGEWIRSRGRNFLLDGAHNPQGMAAFQEMLLLPGVPKEKILVLGILQDKDLSRMLLGLERFFDTVVLTTPESPRAAAPGHLKTLCAGRFPRIHVEEDPARALELAAGLVSEQGLVCLAGSLYLVFPCREMLLAKTEGEHDAHL
ncbi:bifunctional folylpolyglutamate synthase/dihydrofolate synthase [Anaerotalea alkaliphila]|uniref:tetrahydrofolate synthase n=1 Tax=Anaerotalea alkaliphila TaxID=2662126 RepID=A0A7X5HV78_9FIRM|nr:Mur ligase family protein [Anaerotalea alkaliphila]NDL67224.1 hypothetical protein [Anaerotalea alkaliphila]